MKLCWAAHAGLLDPPMLILLLKILTQTYCSDTESSVTELLPRKGFEMSKMTS